MLLHTKVIDDADSVLLVRPNLAHRGGLGLGLSQYHGRIRTMQNELIDLTQV
jgi:hypothetical protein